MTPAIAIALASLTASGAAALPARESAFVGVERASIGVFAPLTLRLADGVELRGHPLVFLVAPNAVLRVEHADLGGFRIAGEYGLSIPTFGMRLARGYLFSTAARIPVMAIPSLGVVASRGDPSGTVWSLSADVALRVRFGRDDLTPMDAPAPLEMVFATAAGGYRVRVGGAYDAALGERWRLRGYADGFLIPSRELSPLAFRIGAEAHLLVGRASRFAFGVVYWNADQGDYDPATGGRLRSNDFLPTLDFIWAWH